MSSRLPLLVKPCWQNYLIGTARKMSVGVDATLDLLLLTQQKLRSTDTVVFPPCPRLVSFFVVAYT